MMRDHSAQLDPSERLQSEHTRKPLHRWGGLVALARDFDLLGFRALLEPALPDGRISLNQVPAVEIVLACFAAVLTGATRFAPVARLRADAVVRAVLGNHARLVTPDPVAGAEAAECVPAPSATAQLGVSGQMESGAFFRHEVSKRSLAPHGGVCYTSCRAFARSWKLWS
jgi:hypothetical protein